MVNNEQGMRRRSDNITFFKKLFDPQNVYAILLIMAAVFFISVNIYSIPRIAEACEQNSRDIIKTSAELSEMRAAYTREHGQDICGAFAH
jgi:hypothetical protein